MAIVATVFSFGAFNGLNSNLYEKERALKEKDQLIELMKKSQSTKRDKKTTYRYFVANKDLKAGHKLEKSDIDQKTFETKKIDSVKSEKDLVGKILLKSISDGQAFSISHVPSLLDSGIELKKGYRALTLPAASFQGKTNDMEVGTSVDVFTSSSKNNWSLENIRIIGLESRTGDDSSMLNSQSITFEVPASDIQNFISNSSRNKMVLVARSPYDTTSKKRSVVKKSVAPEDTVLPSLPKAPEIKNLSGLPDPLQPDSSSYEVEMIEANVKSKVQFE